MVFLDYWGYPVESIRGHWLSNILRRLFRTRRICRGYWDGYRVLRHKDSIDPQPDPETMKQAMEDVKVGRSQTPQEILDEIRDRKV